MTSTPAEPYGTVVSEVGAHVREFPSTDSSIVGSLTNGAKVGLRSKVRAQDIDGNNIWYLLRDRNAWIAARYVSNSGSVKWAKDAAPGEAGEEAAG
ncbi:SH3 domain-containing protein [Streptomyces sp. MBT27]|uniref:SH3 domain-containing protein n=1 Tax=Streptomyces sp. MBT27 TaxID=1488356 RepID=UPI00141DD803|nr:SH3 domain-containing protein [Streptomyces sp. MBT27]